MTGVRNTGAHMTEPSDFVAIVTTSRRPPESAVIQSRALAKRIRGRYIERRELSIAELLSEAGGLPVVSVETDRVVCHHAGGVFFFHPGLVQMRLYDQMHSRPDPAVEALNVRPGDRVLDATLGRGGDALVIAAAVGSGGGVVGVESSPIVAELARLGLSTYEPASSFLRDAMRRIEVICADHRHFLASCPTDSFDSVYFDPMFDRPLRDCASIEPLRALARHEDLDRAVVEEAKRVARRRVVVKSRRGARTLVDLGIPQQPGGRYSRVAYGVIECD